MKLSFEYSVKRTRRKNLGVYVYPHGEVQIRAPLRARERDIQAFVKHSADWVEQTLSGLPEHIEKPVPRFTEGEHHHYLGMALSLRLVTGNTHKIQVVDDCVQLISPNTFDEAKVEKQLTEWYRRQAKAIFSEVVMSELHKMGWGHRFSPVVKVRKMKSRWGSCSSKGEITLSLNLIRYPMHLIQYVVIHELCHLEEFNHSPKFYALMDLHCPDWKQRKRELEASSY